jgi:translocation and assembly module TamA
MVVVVAGVRRAGADHDDRDRHQCDDHDDTADHVVGDHQGSCATHECEARSVTAPRLNHHCRRAWLSAGVRLARRLLCLLLLATPALAQEAPEPRDKEGNAAGYTVEIAAPDDLLKVLRQDLDLLRWRDYPSTTRDLLERLVIEAEQQLSETLATEGYFSPRITRTIEGDAPPWRVRIEIEPGAPTRVGEITLTVSGTIANDPARAEQRRKRILERWPLPEGARFRQQDWDLAKRRALEEVAGDRFAAARVQSSRATIDPQTRRAHLVLDIDSGPGFRFGAVEVRGLARYAESTVRNLAPFKPGDAYDEDALLLFQRRLVATGYFSAVQVEIDDDPTRAAEAPVRVSLIEANSRRIDAGLGYSTDTLYRGQLGYTSNDFRGMGWRWRSEARVESRAARASSTITLPARDDGWVHAYALRFNQSDTSGLEQRDGNVTFTRTALDERRQPQWSLSAHLQQQQPEGAPSDTVHAVFAAFRYTRRATDDLIAPSRGTMLSAQIGVAPPGLSSQGFLRGVGQAAAWVPLGRSNTVVLRAEGGAVVTRGDGGVPESFLFRTGGDTTIRGYAFESIGVARGAAVVGGRVFGLASAEAQHWLGERFGVAVFYDVGNAAARLSEMKPLAQGAGVGARVRTPLGPVRVDLAWGERTRQVRLHLSLGVNF